MSFERPINFAILYLNKDKRMAKAMDEISHYPEYDYIIINSDLSESVKRVRSILHAERLKRGRQIGLIHFVKQLRDGR